MDDTTRTSVDSLRAAPKPPPSMKQIAELPRDRQFPKMLELFKGEIANALPQHMNADRLARIALTCFRKTPGLLKCDPASVFAAVIQGAQLGLEPGIGGMAYLIPYGNECQFIPGWKGLVDLVSRTGRATVWTGAVFHGDHFDWSLGDRPFIRHQPMGENDPAKMLFVYAVGRINGGEWPVIEVWTNQRALAHRDRYNKVGKKHYSYANWEMYARKIVLLQVLKYMPQSVELQVAMAFDHADGAQRLTLKEAIEGTWSPVERDEDDLRESEDGSKEAPASGGAGSGAGAEQQPATGAGAAAQADPFPDETKKEPPGQKRARGRTVE